METILFIGAIILLCLGALGTILPVLPGPPLAWSALLLEYFMESSGMTVTLLVITFIVAVVVTIMDFAFPTIQTKKSGGTKYGTWGSTIGILVGPFIGAFIGEMINDSSDYHKALRSAWASFIGFLSGTLMKIVTVSVFIIIFILRLK